MESSLVVLYIFFLSSVYTSTFNDGANSDPSSELSTCPEIPTIENAEVSPNSLKDKYTAGDTLTYTCQQGYTGRIIFKCNGQNWENNRNSKCSRKRCELPQDIPNGRFVVVNGTEFVYGTIIKYICKTGYRMVTLVDTRTCLTEGWSNRLPECEEIVCSPPLVQDGITVDGLPDYDNPLSYGHHLQFTCSFSGFKLVGPKEAICGENGEWSNPLPTCKEITCELKEVHRKVSVVGLPQKNAPIKYGHKLQFYCSQPDMVLTGNREVICSGEGEWSSPFPICEVKKGCGPPPHVEFADLISFPKSYYSSGERVEYICQQWYTTHGQPFKTCEHGVWSGSMQCLKPCILSIEIMDAHGITQYYGQKRRMFSQHGDYITFACQYGRRPSFNVAFRQQCNDGRMHLPTCQ